MPATPERIRVTISLSKDIADKIDDIVDGVKIRNRSHAIETLVTDSLDLLQVRHAVILAGGEHALKRIAAIKQILPTLYKYGINDIYIAVGYLGERVRQQLGDHPGMNINYIETQLGTGGSLVELKSKLRHTFLVININQPVEIDLKSLLRFHRDHRPIVTIATRSLKDLDGIYVMEPKVFQFIPDGFVMLEDTVFHELTKQGKLLSYPILQEKSERSFN
jgi:hypothetical protein